MELTFEDALRIARGCTYYGGGHRGNTERYEIYHHGIQTVINALTAASKTGLDDTQTKALHSMGANATNSADAEGGCAGVRQNLPRQGHPVTPLPRNHDVTPPLHTRR